MASSRVRGFWIAEALEQQNVKCCIEYRHSGKALLRFLLRIILYDIIFFQKTYSRWHCLLLRFANLLNKKSVLDLDDAPSITKHPVTLQNVEFMMRNVSAVTVGSQVLHDYARQYSKNVHLVPSSINLKYYQPIEKVAQADRPVCLGWIGNGRQYKEDLIAILHDPLVKIAKQHSVRFKLIGACGERDLYEAFRNIQGLELDFVDQIDWANTREVVQMLQDIDIGLYPLLQNDFNKFKCGFKALEYMAVAIPVVSSSVAINSIIINHREDGLLADTEDEWACALIELVCNERIRREMGFAGRKKIEEHFNIAATSNQILSIVRRSS